MKAFFFSPGKSLFGNAVSVYKYRPGSAISSLQISLQKILFQHIPCFWYFIIGAKELLLLHSGFSSTVFTADHPVDIHPR
jgi:hypothetical protein